MTTVNSFVNRLKKIGIEVELVGNFPWVYLDKVNGVKVWERYQANHGFTVFFMAIRQGQKDSLTNITTIFKKIRDMLTPEGQKEDQLKYEIFMEDYMS